MASLRAFTRFCLFLSLCALLIPPQITIVALTRGTATFILPQFFHRCVCRIFAIKISITGTPARTRPVLYVGNHVSYLDIPAISTVLSVSFVAKAEVAGWPLFGLLAKLQRTAFIDRARTAAAAGKDDLHARLVGGDSLVIFPEGTSSDGTTALPFKSALFSAALQDGGVPGLLVQPFTLELLEADGRPVTTRADRDLYAWYGDMTLMPHFWHFGKIRGAHIKIHFHPPMAMQGGDDRKKLAQECHRQVINVLSPLDMPAAA